MAEFTYVSSAVGAAVGSQGTARRAHAGLIFFSMDTEAFVGAIRDKMGRFTKAQSQMAEVNRRLALELAEAVVEQLETSYERPGASTGRLAQAMMDSRNRRADQFGFGVGVISFLDESQAKYWRAIEQGTTHFLGKQLTGYWLDGGEVAPFGVPNPAGRFVPGSRKSAYEILRAAGHTSREASRTKGIIKVPIEPHRYLSEAWGEFNVRERTVAAVQEVFRELGLPVPQRR